MIIKKNDLSKKFQVKIEYFLLNSRNPWNFEKLTVLNS